MLIANRYTRLATTLGLCLPIGAMAQSGAPDDLDKIVVTATRTAVTVDASLAAVEVIDRKAIERSQAHSLPQLLRGRAGINLVNQGGLGKLTTLFLRGTESDHTLFLVDGVRIGSSTSGLAGLQDIPVESIERIEIVRGPRSSLYGSEAIGGVIQIFTRRQTMGIHPAFSVGAGSHGLREGSAGIDVGSARGWFGVTASTQHDQGINACRVATPSPFSGGCFITTPQPDRDGYAKRSLSVHAGLHATGALTVEANALRSEGHNTYDANPDFGLPDNSRTVQQVVGGTLRYQPGNRVSLQVSAGRNVDSSNDFMQDTFVDRFDSRRDSASMQGDVGLRQSDVLTIGYDWLRDFTTGTPFTKFDPSRNNRGTFMQYQGNFGPASLQASVRHDDNDQFGGHDTGGLALGFDATHGLRLTTSVGTAFKAPTFNELYYPYYGNQFLLPEASRSIELGLSQHLGPMHWQLSAYQTTVSKLITYDASIFKANNLDRARIRGAELTAGTTLAGWDLAADASITDPRNRSSIDAGNLLPRRARRSARVDVDRAVGRWQFGASWIAEGGRFDDVKNTIYVGGHATLDLRTQFALSSAWTVLGDLRNAFDRRYETAAFYNQPGREFAISLRWRPAD